MATTTKKVSIQGYKGAFHQIAAEALLSPEITVLEREFFTQVFEDLKTGEVEYGVVATKNSIFGEISEVTKLFTANPNIQVIKELALPIQQNLIVIPGTQLSELREVHSQLPALEQCSLFFANHPELKKVETSDTALSVKSMMEKSDRSVGAIASTLAAKIYGAEILLPAIQDSIDNITTFVLIRKAK